MIDIFTTKMTGRPVASVCPSVSRLRGTGVSPVGLFGSEPGNSALRDERPAKAFAAAVAAQVPTCAAAAADAGTGLVMASQTDSRTKQYRTTEHHTMWAFRGPDPWRDPA